MVVVVVGDDDVVVVVGNEVVVVEVLVVLVVVDAVGGNGTMGGVLMVTGIPKRDSRTWSEIGVEYAPFSSGSATPSWWTRPSEPTQAVISTSWESTRYANSLNSALAAGSRFDAAVRSIGPL